MGKRRALAIGTAAAVVAAAVSLTATGVLRSPQADMAAAGEQSALPTTAPTPSPTPSPTAGTTASAPAPQLSPVLAAVDDPAGTAPSRLAARISGAGSPGGDVSAAVLSGDSGELLYKHGAATPLIPASTNKLLTSTAALQLLGPEHRFTTSVVTDADLSPTVSPSPSSPAPTNSASSDGAGAAKKPRSAAITLVGGGDPYLASTNAKATDPGQASLQNLAAATASKLRKAGIVSVRLGYDASLFTGPSWNPDWPAGYADVVTRTSALWAEEGRLYGAEGPRQSDPAGSAAAVFAALLKKDGIKVTGVDPSRAPADARPVAVAESLTVERIVERLLQASDNDAAEVMLRQVAIAAGRPGSIDNGLAAVRQTLTRLGAWVDGTATTDGSGLARTNRVSADELVKVVALAVNGSHARLGALLTGLPVAGVEGSLHYRFSTTGTTGGRGLVRAKTGTLRLVHALAGYSYTRDGELLVYAFVVNNAKNDWSAVTWLDRVSAAVATCGCRT